MNSTMLDQASSGEIPRRPLGKTGLQVSVAGVGGYHVDTAESGEAGGRVGKPLVGKRDKVTLMTKVCTHGRDSKVAMQEPGESPDPDIHVQLATSEELPV